MSREDKTDAKENAALKDVGRRRLLQSAGAAGALAVLGKAESLFASNTQVQPLQMSNTGSNQIPRKPFGKTGEQVSIIGIGGATLGQASSLQVAVNIVHEAIDAGVNFMDNAWEYNEHRSEEWMGQALQGRRDQVFLMTKVCTHGRDAQVGMQQLEESLRR